jgi:hypothetical protein
LFPLLEELLNLFPLFQFRLGLQQLLECGDFTPALGWVEDDFFKFLHHRPGAETWPEPKMVAFVARSRMTIRS